MSPDKENVASYMSLVIYAIVGATLRYFITLPCDSGFQSVHVAIGLGAIPYIMIGIGFGLFSFIFPDKKISKIGRGVVTGLSVGFGGMTVYILATNPCM